MAIREQREISALIKPRSSSASGLSSRAIRRTSSRLSRTVSAIWRRSVGESRPTSAACSIWIAAAVRVCPISSCSSPAKRWRSLSWAARATRALSCRSRSRRSSISLKAWLRKNGGYEALKKALEMAPAAGHRRGEEVEPPRPRRRRLPHRHQVELRPQGQPQAQVPLRQRRRVRAGHLQGPLHPRVRPALAARGHRDRLLRARRAHLLHLHPRRVQAARRDPARRRIDEAYAAGIFGKKMLGKDFALDVLPWSAAPARTSAARRPRCWSRLEGKKGWPRLKPPFPAVVGLFGAPTVVNNVETLASVPAIIEMGAEWYAELGTDKSRRHAAGLPLGHGEPPGRLRDRAVDHLHAS